VRASLIFVAMATLASAALTGCSDTPKESPSPTPTPTNCEVSSPPATVQWKRTGAVLSDLGQALALDSTQVCQELGVISCEVVHRVSLGGNDPFDRALYKPFTEPLGTTPLAAERVVMQACVKRVELDKASATPAVWKNLDLNSADISANVGPDSGFYKDTVELGRRLLGRDPSADEIAELAVLAKDEAGAPVPSAEVAKLVCFALGTSKEFLFF
jgi:hypothetical protein